MLSKLSYAPRKDRFHAARCIRCRLAAEAQALASSLLDVVAVHRPLTRSDLLALLDVAGLTQGREELEGTARSIVTSGHVMIGRFDDDKDGDPWILCHAIAHRIYDLRAGLYVCVDAETYAEERADRLAGFLLIGSLPELHGATIGTRLSPSTRDLVAATGVSIERIRRWSDLIRCPDAPVAPASPAVSMPLHHSSQN